MNNSTNNKKKRIQNNNLKEGTKFIEKKNKKIYLFLKNIII